MMRRSICRNRDWFRKEFGSSWGEDAQSVLYGGEGAIQVNVCVNSNDIGGEDAIPGC